MVESLTAFHFDLRYNNTVNMATMAATSQWLPLLAIYLTRKLNNGVLYAGLQL